jgi:hypothetical protein
MKSFTCDPKPKPMKLKQMLQTVAAKEKERHANAPKINMYVCAVCGGRIVTEDVDAGVTPMFVLCRVTENCTGSMISSMYRVAQDLTPTFEWYRPKNFRAIHDTATQGHVLSGGLLLREKSLTA